MSRRRKFVELGGERIPVIEDAATVIYLADECGHWPSKPLNYIRQDLPWLVEGSVLELEDLNPASGEMGETRTVMVLETQVRVQLYPGKYGQVIRKVLVKPAPPMSEVFDQLSH